MERPLRCWRRCLHQIRLLLAGGSSRTSVATTTATNFANLFGATAGGVAAARALGPSGRGELAVLVIWGSVLQAGSTLGLPHAFGYMLARRPFERDALAEYVSGVAVRLALLGVGMVGVAFLTLVAVRKVDAVAGVTFLVWVPAATISVFATSYFHGVGGFAKFNILRLIPGTGTGVLLLVFAASGVLTVRSAAGAYVLASGVSAALGGAWIRRELKVPPGSMAFEQRSRLWKLAKGNLFALLTTSMNARVDQLAISLLAAPAHLGLYSVAATSSTIMGPLTSGIAVIGFNRVASERVAQSQIRIVHRLVKISAIVAAIAVCVFWVSADWVIPLVFGDAFGVAVAPARILAVGSFFLAINYVLEEALRGRGLPRVVGYAEVLGASVTVLGILMLRHRGLPGMAAASTIGYCATTIVALHWVSKIGNSHE